MLPKPRRPREERIEPLTRATYSIAEFCEKTGLSRAIVTRQIDDGILRTVKLGFRLLILAKRSQVGLDPMVASLRPDQLFPPQCRVRRSRHPSPKS